MRRVKDNPPYRSTKKARRVARFEIWRLASRSASGSLGGRLGLSLLGVSRLGLVFILRCFLELLDRLAKTASERRQFRTPEEYEDDNQNDEELSRSETERGEHEHGE